MGTKGAEPKWLGLPIHDIINSQSSEGAMRWKGPQLPAVIPSQDHSVLYQIHRDGKMLPGHPRPYEAPRDQTTGDHVKMPFHDSESVWNYKKQMWEPKWNVIQRELLKYFHNVNDLIQTIVTYNQDLYKYKKHMLQSLTQCIDTNMNDQEKQYFFEVTLRNIANLALQLPSFIKAPLPLLTKHRNMSVSLSQMQVASLLANAFFCTFPLQGNRNENYPNINFSKLYSRSSPGVSSKLMCIINYFNRVTTEKPDGIVTFSRRYVPPEQCPGWKDSCELISCLRLHVDTETSISDADALIQVDFANKYIGGGVIGNGTVQEEIMFATRTEMIVAKLFTEKMDDTEALMIIGCQCYNSYVGYSNNFRWTGNYRDDTTPYDSSGRRRIAVLAIDALPMRGIQQKQQNMDFITRELNKAWVGVSFFTKEDNYYNFPGVATGNWGCGAFRGSKILKYLIQLMACAKARRPMAFFTFHDKKMMQDINQMFIALSKDHVTIGMLYKYLTKSVKNNIPPGQLASYIQNAIVKGVQTLKKSHEVQDNPNQPRSNIYLTNSNTLQKPDTNPATHQKTNKMPQSQANVNSEDARVTDTLENQSHLVQKTLSNAALELHIGKLTAKVKNQIAAPQSPHSETFN